MNLYLIFRLSFKKNQFYFRTIRKLKIEELPAYEFRIRMRLKFRMKFWMKPADRKR